MKRVTLVTLVFLMSVSLVYGAQGGVKKRKALPHEYGMVVLNNHAYQAGMPPVTFDHWLHRQHYTCRLCHVDIGFGMIAGTTNLRAIDNKKGFFCGTCHNGRYMLHNKVVFSACDPDYVPGSTNMENCYKCHTTGSNPAREAAFHLLSGRMPSEKFGNGINWELAETSGRIKLNDRIAGVSTTSDMLIEPDFTIKSKSHGMPDIIFSHAKHTVWNGCEVCHPDIFLGIKTGETKYTMIDLFQGRYCGACHDKVAFPQTDCKRCHAKPM